MLCPSLCVCKNSFTVAAQHHTRGGPLITSRSICCCRYKMHTDLGASCAAGSIDVYSRCNALESFTIGRHAVDHFARDRRYTASALRSRRIRFETARATTTAVSIARAAGRHPTFVCNRSTRSGHKVREALLGSRFSSEEVRRSERLLLPFVHPN